MLKIKNLSRIIGQDTSNICYKGFEGVGVMRIRAISDTFDAFHYHIFQRFVYRIVAMEFSKKSIHAG